VSPLTAVLLLALGALAGTYGTIVGAGGGFVIVPAFLLVYPNDSAATVTGISLAVVLCNATSGSAAYARLRRIDYRTGVAFALATIPGAVAGALATQVAPRRAFDGLFGIVLISVSTYVAFRPALSEAGGRWQPRPNTYRSLVDVEGNRYSYAFNWQTGVGISFFVGLLASFLGLGGGIIHVPVMVALLGFPAHVAVATSHFILVFTSLAATLVHVATGSLTGNWQKVIPLAVGAIVGAQAGARLSQRLPEKAIVRLLALALFTVGIRLLVAAAGV
jgi:uncharacterized membrane protein YfcA